MRDWNRIEKTMADVKGHWAPRTAVGGRKALAQLHKFCDDDGVDGWHAFDAAAAIRFIHWLKRRRYSGNSIRKVCSIAFNLVSTLQQMEPGVVSDAYVYPAAHIPALQRGYHGKVLCEEELSAIMAACLKDVKMVTAATPASLVPFLVLLCLRTGMNPYAAMELRRDCLRPNPRGGMDLVWLKRRARRELRQRHYPEPWGVIEVVRRLWELTRGDALFSYMGRPGRTCMLRGYAELLVKWRMRHNLPAFTLRDLRAAAATFICARESGGLMEAKEFLQHRNVDTTLCYLSEAVIRPRNDAVLARSQAAMYCRLVGDV